MLHFLGRTPEIGKIMLAEENEMVGNFVIRYRQSVATEAYMLFIAVKRGNTLYNLPQAKPKNIDNKDMHNTDAAAIQ